MDGTHTASVTPVITGQWFKDSNHTVCHPCCNRTVVQGLNEKELTTQQFVSEGKASLAVLTTFHSPQPPAIHHYSWMSPGRVPCPAGPYGAGWGSSRRKPQVVEHLATRIASSPWELQYRPTHGYKTPLVVSAQDTTIPRVTRTHKKLNSSIAFSSKQQFFHCREVNLLNTGEGRGSKWAGEGVQYLCIVSVSVSSIIRQQA